MYKKNFDEWNSVKKGLDDHDFKPPLFKEREIWWCSFGVNIGSEVCGKNSSFRRPVLIVKKLSHTSFIGVPLSTKENIGSWYVQITHSDGKVNVANIAQIRYIDYRRLDKKIGTLDSGDFEKIQGQLRTLLGL
jgi:mRNA interferase MazF